MFNKQLILWTLERILNDTNQFFLLRCSSFSSCLRTTLPSPLGCTMRPCCGTLQPTQTPERVSSEHWVWCWENKWRALHRTSLSRWKRQIVNYVQDRVIWKEQRKYTTRPPQSAFSNILLHLKWSSNIVGLHVCAICSLCRQWKRKRKRKPQSSVQTTRRKKLWMCRALPLQSRKCPSQPSWPWSGAKSQRSLRVKKR